jgi:zinc transporter
MERGLLSAMLLDGQGGAQSLDWEAIDRWQATDGVLWLHLDRTVLGAQQWLSESAGLDEFICDALLAEETRPRYTRLPEGLLVNLRGVNLNPGADTEDMVSVRLWIEEHRIISLRRYHVRSIEDIRRALLENYGPSGPGQFLVYLADRLTQHMVPVVEDLADAVGELEEQVAVSTDYHANPRLTEVRRIAIILRRYIAPQQELLRGLEREPIPWLTQDNRELLHETVDAITRCVEELTASRDRTAVVYDELYSRLAARMNRTMYLLTVVATILLPLSFITGLLGINVGGIPGADSPFGFGVVLLIIAGLATGELIMLRWLRWI